MNSSTRMRLTRREATIRAEGAAWLARLHGPGRTRDVEAGFRRWLAESPAHAEDFEFLSDVWDMSRALKRSTRFMAGIGMRAFVFVLLLSFASSVVAQTSRHWTDDQVRARNPNPGREQQLE